MELEGKIFDIKGENKKVVNTDEDFAYFADGARIKKDALVTKYEEVMDPNEFFNTTNGLSGLADEIDNIDTNKITESITGPATNVNETGSRETVVNEQPVVEEKVTRIDKTGLKPETQADGFFSKIKRNNSIEIDFSITEKFPDLDFVRMMNDNYETSIIEHFAREIVEKMIFDPEILMESIKKSINKIVYGEGVEENDNKEKINENVDLKEVKQETPFSNELKSENDNSDAIQKITEERKVVEIKQETITDEQETSEESKDSNDEGELEQQA